MYCTDTDLLLWEPAVFVEAMLAAQVLLETRAALAGQTLTLGGAEQFAATRVRATHVVVIEGESSTASLPICSIESATVATLDRRWIRVAASEGDVVARVRTFAAQRQIISNLLDRIVKFDSGRRLHDPRVLRRACALGTLHMIYAALAAASPSENADLIVRTELYARLYRKELRGLMVDLCGDDEFRDETDVVHATLSSI